MRSFVRGVAIASLLLAAAAPAMADPSSAPRRPVQFVIISFDGAHDLAQWRRSRTLARRTGATFTYFLSCVFLLSPQTKSAYHPPRMKAGRSNVGFAASREEVEQRLYQIRLAAGEGHELASHGCGHFDGRHWTAADWSREFDAFRTILGDAYRINGIGPEPADWPGIVDSVQGFRAPYLSAGPAMHEALAGHGFAYDASGVSRGPAEPDARGPVLRFALPQIAEGPKGRPVIAMDYNLYVRHSGGKDQPARGQAFERRAYEAFKAAFDGQHEGARTPLQLGFHFTLMNGDAYWRALERFTQEVCVKPDVRCVTYSDYIRETGGIASAAAHHSRSGI